jgi:hypothetical protein
MAYNLTLFTSLEEYNVPERGILLVDYLDTALVAISKKPHSGTRRCISGI